MIHRFVNTTPKPSATKNSNGELELPWLFGGLFGEGGLVVVDAGGGEDDVVLGTLLVRSVEDGTPEDVGDGESVDARVVVACRMTMAAPSRA